MSGRDCGGALTCRKNEIHLAGIVLRWFTPHAREKSSHFRTQAPKTLSWAKFKNERYQFLLVSFLQPPFSLSPTPFSCSTFLVTLLLLRVPQGPREVAAWPPTFPALRGLTRPGQSCRKISAIEEQQHVEQRARIRATTAIMRQ